MSVTDYDKEIAAAAAEHDLSPGLLTAQVLVESSGHADAFRFEPGIAAQLAAGRLKPKYMPTNPAVRRVASSYGLLQILYVTACDYGFVDAPERLFIPDVGLRFGAAHMSAMLRKAEGDYTRALCAYNGGWGAVMTLPYRTQAYADKVYAQARRLGIKV